MGNKSIKTAIILVIFGALCWAPWLNNQKLHNQVFESYRSRRDGTIDKDGKLVCDYNIVWMPFGRWVGSCEGGYYVTFWGKIL